MPSDFKNIKDSGRACVGCGRTSDQVVLKRLRTYGLSLCCGACLLNPKYANCANKNPLGTICGHEPSQHRKIVGACTIDGCGCANWIHGLDTDFDRMQAAGVGLAPTMKECQGFGQNLGKCGKIILVGADGEFSRLCHDCERQWVQDTREGLRDVQKIIELDEKMVLPN